MSELIKQALEEVQGDIEMLVRKYEERLHPPTFFNWLVLCVARSALASRSGSPGVVMASLTECMSLADYNEESVEEFKGFLSKLGYSR